MMNISDCSRLIGVVVCLSAGLLHGADKDFWDTKPYTEWTEKEVNKLLKDSPWSQIMVISTGAAGFGDAGPRGGGDAGGGDQGEGGGRAGSAAGMRPTQTVTISWYSRPLREAMARRVMLENPSAPDEQVRRMLEAPAAPFYDLLINGAPLRTRGGNQEEVVRKLRDQSYLQKRNKERIPIHDVMIPRTPGQPLILRFAREIDGKPTLSLEDKEVELVAKVGDHTLRMRFKLADMVIHGTPEF